MRKLIKIFLGSSIVEFKNERQDIENFIYRISRSFEKNYNVSVEPLLCEGFDDAYSKIRKQDEYNEKVRESDLCFFIFFTKAGQYTREEFEVARNRFLETGKPKIYTYFKVLGDETAEESLTEFMDELDKVFTHYYGTFEHIDTVKLRILLNLKLQELDFVEIKTEGDYCTVDGVKALPLENISEFANNQIFKELKAELQETEERYFALKARYVSDDCTEGEAREYAEIATKRSNLLEAIEELRKSIFNMSLRMCKDEIRGEITPRQKEAYRLFEAGDIEGANRILDFSEIKSEYERKKAIRKAEQQKETQIFIRETKTKIDMLGMLTKIDNRFQEIEALYDEITAEAFDIGVEADAVIDFVRFLYEQNKHQKAYETAVMLKEIFVDEGKITDSDEIARVYLYLGTVCSEMPSKKDEAEEYLIKAIEISEELARQNPERFNADLAESLNNAGVFYFDYGQSEKAEEYYKKAIAIREELARQNPERFNPSLADSLDNAGVFYNDQGQQEKAEEYYIKAIVIREELVRQNPERFNADLARSLVNAGNFYYKQGQVEKAEEYYKKAIGIFEELARQNPERFNANLAGSLDNAGVFYKEQGQPEKAEEYYKKAIAIREELARQNPERFKPDFADSLNNAGVFYNDQGQQEKAEEYYKKAIEIREELARQNPERFKPDLAGSLNNVGVFYFDQGQPEKAEEYYKKAIAIREELARQNPERFKPDLADSLNNAGNFYSNQGQLEKAEEYYIKAIAIREELARQNPERFNAALADSLNNTGIFYNKQGQPEKAEKYYKKAIAIGEELARQNPERFNAALARSYNNAGNFYSNQGQAEKAELYYIKAVEIYEELARQNPERFNAALATSYNNAGIFYYEQRQPKKAEKYYKKAIAIREELARQNPQRFNPELAGTYFNFAILMNDTSYFVKAFELARTVPEHPVCKQIIESYRE